MPIDGITPVGDDQRWKSQIERSIEQLRAQLESIRLDIDYLMRKVK